MIITATAYSWLVDQGLWPTVLGASIYWLIPLAGAAVFAKKTWTRLVTEYKHWKTLYAQHTEAAQDKAVHLDRIATQLEESNK